MNYDYPQSDLSRGVLSGLFSGIVSTVINLLFIIIYRYATQFTEFNGIDMYVIISGSILLSIACGIVFYWFVHYLNKGVNVYRISVAVVTVGIILIGIIIRSSVMGDAPFDFRMLVTGTQIIIGLCAIVLIPYLFRHDSMIS